MLKEWAAARLAGTRDVKSDDRRRKKLGLSGVWLKFLVPMRRCGALK
jgi:hypothetical protein